MRRGRHSAIGPTTLGLATLGLALTALLAGCAAQQREDSLERTLAEYKATLRWGDLQTAVQFLDPELEEDLRPTRLEIDRYKQFRVTSYTERRRRLDGDARELVHWVEIRLVNRHTAAERRVVARQRWRYDAKAERWWLVSGLPDITRDRP